jgi:ketosteroid isomerase-like protein
VGYQTERSGATQLNSDHPSELRSPQFGFRTQYRTQEVAGSSPASSIFVESPAQAEISLGPDDLAATASQRDTERAMSQENVELVREVFESFLGGDLEKTAQLVDPEVEFHGTVGGLEEGRVAHGLPQAVQTFWGEEDLEAWDERRLEAEEFIDAGDDVVVLLHEFRRGRRSGIELETETAVVVAVSGGRVVRIQGYMDRHAALEAAGLSE